LGQGRKTRGALRDLGEDFVYGHRPRGRDDWDAKKCLQGQYAEHEQLPDKNLGVSSRKITQLEQIPPEHSGRSYGTPSIRLDLPRPTIRSVADDQNYGDEPNGKGLIYPENFACDGVSEEDFRIQRTPNQIRAVFKAMGAEFTDAEFQRICELASKLYEGVLSVDSFRHAWNKSRNEAVCSLCGGVQCQHELCKFNRCSHSKNINHAPQHNTSYID